MKDIMSIKKRLEQKSAINGKAGVAIMSDMLNEEKIRPLINDFLRKMAKFRYQ